MRHLCLAFLVFGTCFCLLATGCFGGGEDSGASSGGGGGGGTGGLALVTATLPGAQVGASYSATLNASGGTAPYTWALTGSVPPGLTLDTAGSTASTTLSGTPTAQGPFTFTITVSDAASSAFRNFTLNVGPGAEGALRQVIANKGITGLTTASLPTLNANQVALGRMLFFDKILSGNMDVACATCHHPTENFGDSLNLSVGVGGVGGAGQGNVGPGRTHPNNTFVPRNAQPVFATHLMPAMFWDKRIERPLPPPPPPPPAPPPPPPNFVNTPEGQMQLAPDEAQALFPLVNIAEMRGTGHSLDGLSNTAYRQALVARLQAIPQYVTLFNAAFPAGSTEVGLTVNNIARAIAQYERSLTFINSPWDRYLRGDSTAMTEEQKRGALVFFGRGACDACHNGPLLSNFTTHNEGVPQFGPGQGNGPSGREDFGFENVTGNPQNRYQFRVPPLRNVAVTGPWMHNGAISSLDELMLFYRDKAAFTQAYTGTNMLQGAQLAPTLLPTGPLTANLSPLFLQVPNNLSQQERDDMVAFLNALTDPAFVQRLAEIPATVPSGLSVDQD